MEEIMRTIRSGLRNSEELFHETVESITVFEEYIDIKIRFVPPIFRIWFSTHGRKENYTTVIDCYELLESQTTE